MQYLILLAVAFILCSTAFAFGENNSSNHKTAVFGGGCFWCMEPPFEALDGVIDVKAGYSGGEKRTLVMKWYPVVKRSILSLYRLFMILTRFHFPNYLIRFGAMWILRTRVDSSPIVEIITRPLFFMQQMRKKR